MYQFVGMPNGLACAPRIFTKILTPVYANLREWGHECFPHINDSFEVGDSWESCRDSVVRLCESLDDLGFVIHREKSVLDPQTKLVFLGLELDSQTMTVALPQDKRDKLWRAIHDLLDKRRARIREVKVILSISAILVSFCCQEYLEYKCVYCVFHKNIPNNLECLEHL